MAAFTSSIDITSGGTYKLNIENGESSASVAAGINGKMTNLQTILQAKLPETCTAAALPTTLQFGKLIVWNNTLYFGNSSNAPTKVSSDTVPTHYHSAGDITSGILSTSRGGTGNANGQAASATKLVTARNIRVNLGSTSYASFNGENDITPGITGTLSASHGGTGYTSLSSLKSALGISGQWTYGTFTWTPTSSKTINIGWRPGIVIAVFDRTYTWCTLSDYGQCSYWYNLGSGGAAQGYGSITSTGFQLDATSSSIQSHVDYVAFKA